MEGGVGEPTENTAGRRTFGGHHHLALHGHVDSSVRGAWMNRGNETRSQKDIE